MNWKIETPLFLVSVNGEADMVNEYSIRNLQYLVASKQLVADIQLEGREEDGRPKVVTIQPDGRLTDYIVDMNGNQSMGLVSELMFKILNVQQHEKDC